MDFGIDRYLAAGAVIHAGALGSWQRYARQLEPLRQRLQDDGWL